MTMEEVSYAMLVQAIPEYGLDEDDHYRYKPFTSFLEVDCSFLTPWCWNPSSFGVTGDVKPRTQPKQQFMKFQPGSFLSHEGENFMGETCADEEDEALEKKKQSVCSGELGENNFSSPFLYKEHPSSLAMVGGLSMGACKDLMDEALKTKT